MLLFSKRSAFFFAKKKQKTFIPLPTAHYRNGGSSKLRSLREWSDERDRLDKVSLPTLLYPYWHQAWTANDRLGPADLSLIKPHLS